VSASRCRRYDLPGSFRRRIGKEVAKSIFGAGLRLPCFGFSLAVGEHVGNFSGFPGVALAQFVQDQSEVVVGFGNRLQAIGRGTPGLKKTCFPSAAQDRTGKM